MLSKTLQRYENKSKSQRNWWGTRRVPCCLRLCKDTKIKANHNLFLLFPYLISLSKTLQRYENKSKSQRTLSCIILSVCCLRLCKDTKIKANHNSSVAFISLLWLSKTLQRYENKSKSQLIPFHQYYVPCCLRLCKDTKIKANHNTLFFAKKFLLVV